MRRPRREIEELRDPPPPDGADPIENAAATHRRQRRFALDARLVVVLLVAASGITWQLSHRSHPAAVASATQDVRVGATVDGPVVLRLDRVVQNGSHLTADFFLREPADARLIQSLVILAPTASAPDPEPIQVQPSDVGAQTFSISTFDLPRRDQRVTKLVVARIDFALPGDAEWDVDLAGLWPSRGGVTARTVKRALQAGGVTFTLSAIVARTDGLEFDVLHPNDPPLAFTPELRVASTTIRETSDFDLGGGAPHAVFFNGIPPDARTVTFSLSDISESLAATWSWTLRR